MSLWIGVIILIVIWWKAQAEGDGAFGGALFLAVILGLCPILLPFVVMEARAKKRRRSGRRS